MRKLSFTSEALGNIADITAYIALESGSRSVAEAFVGKVKAKCEKMASLPGVLGRERSELKPDLRSVAFKSYVIFFRYIGDVLEVVTVLEGHRDFATCFRDDEV